MSHSDQKYIDALVNNNPMVEEIYVKFSPLIRSMVLQNGGSETDAQDIFQDSLISIFHTATKRTFILTCPFKAFLYKVCKNKWLTELNKRKVGGVTFRDIEGYNIGKDGFKPDEDSGFVEETSELDMSDDSFKYQEEIGLQDRRRNLIKKKLAELSEGCRELLLLSWSHKSMQEVASILNVSYAYARKKKCECMAKLIRLVEDDSDFKNMKE